jgi:Domain of unknown function (DUF4153)
MNATNSPIVPATPALPPVPGEVDTEPPVRLPRVIFGLALAVAVCDLCFWSLDVTPGFSVAVFFLALTGIILGNREERGGKYAALMMCLMAGAIFEAAVETCITNTLVLLALTIALAGETYFRRVESFWGRWLSQMVALIFAPGRVFWLSARMMEVAFSGGMGWMGGLIGGCVLAIPALVLALIFGSLLATGNAVFGSWFNSFFDWFWKELASLFDFSRIVFWCFAAFLILPFLRPANISSELWKSTILLDRLPEIIPTSGAIFSSGLVLVVLNLLFLIANVADALFLWSGQALPPDVSYKSYVHEGVEALIVTVILSAVVLATLFQQSLKVAQRRELKVLAYIWIVQNLFLIVSVTEKLRRYIVTYEMTVARLSTIIFLALVCVGFVSLTIKIIQARSLAWLINGCLFAIFITFYVTQFMDLAGWSANYNVSVMEKNPDHRFDSYTMCKWGPDVWPALRRAHELAPDDPDITASWQQAVSSSDYVQRAGGDSRYWREFSLRAYLNRWALDDKK